MPANKRRVDPQGVQHRGRVTLHRDASTPQATEPTPVGRSLAKQPTPRAAPAESSRYTPPVKHFRFRPTWHRVIGVVVLLLGVAVIALNEVMLLQRSETLLPGGHNELYLLLGVIVAGSSLWWFGWFDRED